MTDTKEITTETGATEQILTDRTRLQAVPQDNNLRGAYAIVPDDHEVEDMQRFQARPNRVVAHPVVRDPKSFITYLNRYAWPHSILYSNADKFEVTASIDAYPASDDPSHCDHSATLNLALSPEYAAWAFLDGRKLSQVTVGEFLEDRAADVVNPDPATIMEMVMTFDALKKVSFKQSTRLHDGQRQFVYVEENEARGQLKLPEVIILNIPVFEGMEPQKIKVRIRFRIEDGSLVFSFIIADRKAVEREAFERIEDALRVDINEDLMLLRVG